MASLPPDVPRCRGIRDGTRGVDVVAVKRGLSRAGYIRWGNFTPVWGEFAVKATQEFQKDKGIKPLTGYYGSLTHAALVKSHRKGSRTEFAFDAYSIALMRDQCAQLAEMPEERIRAAIVAEAARLYAHRNEIVYSQDRPFRLERPPFVPGELDCSGFVTVCHFIGGAPDPNGRDYDGHGYTGTLMSRGERCSQRDLEAGDLVFYGHTTNRKPAFPVGSPTHVAVYDGDGGVYSQGGPFPPPHIRMKRHPVNYRSVNHYRHFDLKS
jgi:hypothetical protein